MTKLGHVLWIGGSTCSGKSELARRIARRPGYALYRVDEREPKTLDHVDGRHYPSFARWAEMSLDERWVRSSVDELVADTLALCGDLFEMVVTDLAADPTPTIVEGFQLLPELVAPVIPTSRHAVFLVATPEFRRATHYARAHAWTMPVRTSDPERSQRNRLERDDRVGEHVARAASERDLKTIVVDGSRALDDVATQVEAHLELAH